MPTSSQDDSDVGLETLATGTSTPSALSPSSSPGYSPRVSINSQAQRPPTTGSAHSADSTSSSTSQSQNNKKKKFRPFGPLKKLGVWFLGLFDDHPYKVNERWENTVFHLFKRLVTASVLAFFVISGVSHQTFMFKTRSVWSEIQVNTELQLVIFGLLNSVLALLVRDSLNHIAGVLTTRWMIRRDAKGANVIDFELNEELYKPWVSIANFYARQKRDGRALPSILRFVITLVTGSCLLLQGAGINTVGMPKIRWYPEPKALVDVGNDQGYITRNKMRVANVSRMSVWDHGSNLIQYGGGPSWAVAHIIAATSAFSDLSTFSSTPNEDVGWRTIGDPDALMVIAANMTDASAPSNLMMTIHGQPLVDLWNEGNRYHSLGRKAVGWHSKIKLNGLILDTICTEASERPALSWKIKAVEGATVNLEIGYLPSTPSAPIPEFGGAMCTLSLRQVLFDVDHWIVENKWSPSRPDFNVNNWGQEPHKAVQFLPVSDADSAIVAELAGWFDHVSPKLQGIFSDPDQYNLTSFAIQLSDASVKANRAQNRLEGLALVVATVFSSLLSSLRWEYEVIAEETIRQGPIQWQLYGSGPRLKWQWAIVIVLVVTFSVQIFDMVLIVWYRQAKGLWLSVGGMLVAANSSERMKSVRDDQGAGYVGESDKFVRYFVREASLAGQGGIEERAVIVSEQELAAPDTVPGKYVELTKRKAYGIAETA